MPTATEQFCTILAGQLSARVPILVYAMDPRKVRYTIPTMMLKVPEGVNADDRFPTDPNILAVLARAGEVATFVVGVSHPSEALLTGAQPEISCLRLPTENPDYFEWRNVLQTPRGKLCCAELLSDRQLPPYGKEPLLKDIDDVDRLLSIPFEPFDISPEWVRKRQSAFDERCLILWNVATSPAALLYHFAGVENFSLWSIQYRSRLLDAVEQLSERRLNLVDALCAAGAGPVFHTSGYEVFIPPLQSPNNLRQLILPYEQRFCKAVHRHGGYVWVHSHGRVSSFLEDFVAIGGDCLQPLEPPPMGNVDMGEAKRRIGANMTLVGNIQTHDLITAPTAHVRGLVRGLMRVAKPGGRFALSPSAEPITTPAITDLHRDNLLCYFDEGFAAGAY